MYYFVQISVLDYVIIMEMNIANYIINTKNKVSIIQIEARDLWNKILDAR